MISNYVLPMNIGNPEELTMLDIAKEIMAQPLLRSSLDK